MNAKTTGVAAADVTGRLKIVPPPLAPKVDVRPNRKGIGVAPPLGARLTSVSEPLGSAPLSAPSKESRGVIAAVSPVVKSHETLARIR